MGIQKTGIYWVAVGLVAAAVGCGELAPPAYTMADPGAESPPNDVAGDTPSDGKVSLDVGALSLDTPGAPHLLEIKSLTPVVSKDGGEWALEPHEAAISLTVVQWTDRGEPESHTPVENALISMPLTSIGVGFGFWGQVELHLRLTGSDYDVTCHLVFDPDGYVQGAARVDPGVGFEFGELVCPEKESDVGLLIEFRVAEDPRPQNPDLEADSDCDSSPLPEHSQTAVGTVSCVSLDVMGSPTFEVRLWAEPLGPIDGETEFSVQAQLIHPAVIVETYREYVSVAVLAAASIELAQDDGSNPVTVAVSAPCFVDYTKDGSAKAEPLVMTTGVETVKWTAVDGAVTVEATDMTFLLGNPGVTATTHPVPHPGCQWVEVPRLTFP